MHKPPSRFLIILTASLLLFLGIAAGLIWHIERITTWLGAAAAMIVIAWSATQRRRP